MRSRDIHCIPISGFSDLLYLNQGKTTESTITQRIMTGETQPLTPITTQQKKSGRTQSTTAKLTTIQPTTSATFHSSSNGTTQSATPKTTQSTAGGRSHPNTSGTAQLTAITGTTRSSASLTI